jgi:D-alanine transaminase
MDGHFGPINEARVSIEDRGFQFADGVYEAMLFYGEQPLLLDEHLQRLYHSCQELGIDVSKVNFREIICDGVRQAGFDTTLVYLQVTRGTAPRHHIPPRDLQPTIVMTFKAKPAVPTDRRKRGLTVMTMEDFRWGKCNIKAIALLPNVIARMQAVRQGYDDVVFVGPDDTVREASAANLFAVIEGELVTPPQDKSILPGITREWIRRCAAIVDLPVVDRTLKLGDLYIAEEVLLCSTTIDALAVVRVNEHVIASGSPGPWAQRLFDRMQTELMV